MRNDIIFIRSIKEAYVILIENGRHLLNLLLKNRTETIVLVLRDAFFFLHDSFVTRSHNPYSLLKQTSFLAMFFSSLSNGIFGAKKCDEEGMF